MKNEPKIIYEDDRMAVVIKPVGMPSQNNGANDLVMYMKEQTGGDVFIINRLDQPVGGLVLFAKDSKTAAMFEKAETEKHYLTVVCGEPSENGRLEDHIMHNKRTNISKIVNKGMGKPAVLEYKKIWQKENRALLDVRLITGRHHQIRVQMAAAGHPIWGDTKYNPEFKHKRNCTPALFSCSLGFIHPVTGKKMYFEAVPEDEIYKNI